VETELAVPALEEQRHVQPEVKDGEWLVMPIEPQLVAHQVEQVEVCFD
jgi:hypothetical protein